MALTKRQIQKYRTNTSDSESGKTKAQLFSDKYKKLEDEKKEKETADIAEREAYAKELTKKVEEQKEKERTAKIVDELESKTVPFNAQFGANTNTVELTTPSEQQVAQQQAAIGSYNNRMMNPQSQVAKKDSLTTALSNIPVNIQKNSTNTLKSLEDAETDVAQAMQNQYAVDQFNKTGELPGLPETDLTKITTEKKEETVLPGVTRPYTQTEQQVEQLQATISKLNEKKNDVLYRKSQARGTAHQELANEANEIQKEIDTLQKELDSIVSPESNDTTAEENDLPLWQKVANTATYTAGRFGVGAGSTVENWASALQNTLGDLATQGEYSNDQNKLYTYLSEHPEMRRQLYVSGAGQSYAQQKVADAAGVSLDTVKNYVRTSGTEDLREGLEDIEGVSDLWRNSAGNWAESIGQQLPGMMLGAGGVSEGASAATKALSENATLGSIGASVYGQTLEQLGRERGFDTANYVNATLQGAIEVGTEKMGFTGLESLTNPVAATGNTKKSVGRAILSYLANGAEEGLEEVINAPLSEIADRITGISDNQNIVGAGGIFDASEMVEGGASGFAVGMIMGGVGSIAGIVNTVKESNDIKQAVEDLRTLQNEYPPTYRAEIPTDLNSITTETMDNILAEQMRLFEQLEEDVIDGNVKYGDTPESEQVVTNENTDPGQAPAVVNKDTDNTVADTNNTVNDTNGTVSDTDNTISDTNNTTNNTENIETETVEDTVVDEDSDYDYAEDEISTYADEDSDMAKALRTVGANPVSARNTLLEAYNNDAKAAVDALYEEGRRITSEGGDSVQERLAQVEKLRDSVLANSSKLSEEGTQRLTKAFRQYGIKNVIVDSKLVTDAGDTLTNAMYDPATKTIHVSPLLGTDAAMAAYATHELVHHTATAGSNIVSDIIAAKDSLVNAGVMDAEMFNLDRYISAYSDVIQTYGQSAEGKAAVQKYIDSGVDAETAKYRVVEDYINEEIAGDFMAELANDPDIAKKLTADNRNFIQKIYDAIVDFINKLRGKEDVQKYQRLADTLRSILSEKTGETVKTKKVDGVKNSEIANKVAETQETNAEKQKKQPTDKPEVAETESKNKTDTLEEQKAKTESKANGKEDTDTKSSGTFAERIAGWEDTPEGTKIPINGIREDGAIGALGISVDDITFDTDSVAKWEQRRSKSKLYVSVTDQRIIDHIPDVLNSPMVVTNYGTDSLVVYGDVALSGNKSKTVEIVMHKDGDSYTVASVGEFKSKTITKTGLTDVLYLNPNESATVAWFKEHNLEKPAVQNIESIGTQKRFSLSQPVEKTENLVAVHNITEENLAVALSEGGFPMPSIAVVNSADGHNEFGEISVVFGRDTIDPELDKSNKVYSGDAWTPTYPTVEYKASKDLKKRVKDVYDKVSRPDSIIINLYSDPDYVLNTYGGADGLAEHLKKDTSAMGNYLESIGEEVQPITVETTEKMTDVDVKQGEYFLDQLGGRFVEAVNAEAGVIPKTKLKNYAKANEETLRDVYKNYLVDVKGYTETVLPGTMYNLKLVDIVNAIGNAYNVAKGNVEKTTTKVDYDATRAAVKEKADQFGYSRWVDELADEAVEKKGIYNGKDPYTQSGNRRSFDVLHMEYTLENVVKAMMQKGGKAATSNDPYTGIFPASAKEFKNIGEVKKAGETQLQRIDESEYNEIRKKYTDRFVDIAYRIGASQSTMETLIDAVASRKTMQGIDSYLEKNLGEYDVENYTPEIAEEFHDLIKDIQSMPASYFEAKPERVVGIDEIKAFIVPDYTKSGVIEKLNETGKTVLTYTYGDSQSRIDALNSLDGVRFSRDVNSTTKGQRQKQKEQEQVEYLKRQLVTYNSDGTFAKAVKPEAKHKFATDIAKNLAGVPKDVVNEQVSKVWGVIESKDYKTPEDRYDAMYKAAHEAASEIVSSSRVNNVNPLYDQYKDLRDRLRTTPIKPGEAKSDIPDYSDWRKSTIGVLRLTEVEGAFGVDEIWGELSEMYPEFFDSNESDRTAMVEQLAVVAKQLRAVPGNPLVQNAYDGVDSNTGDSILADMENHIAEAILSGYNMLAVETQMAQAQRKYNQSENASAKAYAESMRDAVNAQETFENERIQNENAVKQVQAEYEGATLRFVDEANAELDRAKNAVTKADNTNKLIWAMYEKDQKLASEAIKRANKAMQKAQEKVLNAKNNAKWRSEELRRTQERAALRKNITANLGTLYNSLVKPTNSKHIPAELRSAVAGLLEEFSGTRLTNGKVIDKTVLNSINVGEADANVNIQKGMDNILGIISSQSKTDGSGATKAFVEDLMNNIELLRKMYQEIANGGEDISTKPKIMETKNMAYLEQVQRIVAMVDKFVQNTNAEFLAVKVSNAEDAANSIKESVSRFDPKKAESFKKQYDFITPDTYFKRLGETGETIMKSYRNAQNLQVEIQDGYVNYMLETLGGNYNTSESGWSGKLVDVSTKHDGSIMVPRDQLMEAYCAWQRPVGRRHLRKGGAYFLTQEGTESAERKIVFTSEVANTLFSNLTEQEKSICEAVIEYFSSTLSTYGNNATMYMYGYNKFSDKNYFPIRVAKDSLPTNWDTMDDFSRLENSGFTKAVGDSNSSPISLQGFFKTASDHVVQMAYYASYAPVNNDVTRMIDMPGVRNAIQKHLGSAGLNYIINFEKHIDQKARKESSIYSTDITNKLANAYKRAAVSFNLSTAAKQPLSIVRAVNSIDAKYITKAYAELVDHKKAVSANERMLDNSGIARIKVLGFSDVGFGKSLQERYDAGYSTAIEKHKNAFTRTTAKVYDAVVNDAGMWLAGKADEVTWIRIWRACELEVEDKYSDYTNKQKAKKTAERFAEVVGETQVVDSVLDYTPIMESKEAALYTPFMNENVKQLNSFISAFDALKVAGTKSEKASAKKNLGKVIGTFIANNIILEPLVSVAFSMLRDEEDESDPEGIVGKAINLWLGLPANKDGDAYLKTQEGKEAVEGFINSGYSKSEAEKKAKQAYVWGDIGMDVLTSQVSSNLIGMVPITKTVIEDVIDAIQGYDTSRVDTAGLVKATKSTMALIQRYTEGSEKQKTDVNLWLTAIEDMLAVTGIPMRTVRRDVTALVRNGMQATDSYVAQWELNKLLYNVSNSSARSQKNFYDIMANAAKAGDTDAYKYMSDDLESIITSSSVGVKRSTILSALESRGYEQEIGSDMWYIDLQAGFDLDSFNTSMKVEKMITAVYSATNEDSILPSSISNSFTVNKETVKVEDPIEYQAFAEEAGDFSYMILTNMESSDAYKKLDDQQKVYAIKQAYEYARKRARKNYSSAYDFNNKTYTELYENGATPATVAKEILSKAEDKEYSEDEDE